MCDLDIVVIHSCSGSIVCDGACWSGCIDNILALASGLIAGGTPTVLPVLSEIVVGAPEVLPGVRRAVLQSVSQPRGVMIEIEVTRNLSFHPSRVEDYITDLTIEFDSAPVGRYDDRAKL